MNQIWKINCILSKIQTISITVLHNNHYYMLFNTAITWVYCNGLSLIIQSHTH